MSADEASPRQRTSVRDTIFKPTEVPCLKESLLTGLTVGTAAWAARIMMGHKAPTGTFVTVGCLTACARWYMCWDANAQRDAAVAAMRSRQAQQKLVTQLLRQHKDIQEQIETLGDELSEDAFLDDEEEDEA